MVAERRLRALPGAAPSPIEQAIEHVADAQAVVADAVPVVTLPLLPALRLGAGESIDLVVSPAGEVLLMMVDVAAQGWRPVVMEPDSRWELREAGAQSRVWKPGDHG
jgi:hypothetical protein